MMYVVAVALRSIVSSTTPNRVSAVASEAQDGVCQPCADKWRRCTSASWSASSPSVNLRPSASSLSSRSWHSHPYASPWKRSWQSTYRPLLTRDHTRSPGVRRSGLGMRCVPIVAGHARDPTVMRNLPGHTFRSPCCSTRAPVPSSC
jgi:hypothetical protein